VKSLSGAAPNSDAIRLSHEIAETMREPRREKVLGVGLIVAAEDAFEDLGSDFMSPWTLASAVEDFGELDERFGRALAFARGSHKFARGSGFPRGDEYARPL
jgi:hypothetical protein